jgi:5-methylcytosine-specific restriction endonuclease McrA
MSWAQFDSRYVEHLKLLRLGDFYEVGMALDFAAICWCNEWATDGVLPGPQLTRLVRYPGMRIQRVRVTPALVAQKLVEVGRWEVDGDAYRLHDFLDYSSSRAQRGVARERASRRVIPHDVRTAVVARDGAVCGICGREVLDDMHFDHIVPIVRGGESTVENLRVTHARCNLEKGARWPG